MQDVLQSTTILKFSYSVFQMKIFLRLFYDCSIFCENDWQLNCKHRVDGAWVTAKASTSDALAAEDCLLSLLPRGLLNWAHWWSTFVMAPQTWVICVGSVYRAVLDKFSTLLSFIFLSMVASITVPWLFTSIKWSSVCGHLMSLWLLSLTLSASAVPCVAIIPCFLLLFISAVL